MTPNYTQRIPLVNTTNASAWAYGVSPMDTTKDAVGARLRSLRDERGLTRHEVAEQLGKGFSEPAIQAHEEGRNQVKIAAATRYARFYRRPLLWILTGESGPAGGIDLAALETAIFSAALVFQGKDRLTEADLAQLARHAAAVYARLEDSILEKTA